MPRIQITLSSDNELLDSVAQNELKSILSGAVCTAFGLRSDFIKHINSTALSAEKGAVARVLFDTGSENVDEMQRTVQENVDTEVAGVAEGGGDFGNLKVSVKVLYA